MAYGNQNLTSNLLGGGGKGGKFSDPFFLESDLHFPKDLKSSFDLCLYLYYNNPLYAAVTNKVFSHFLTDISFDTSDNEKKSDESTRRRHREILYDDLDIDVVVNTVGRQWGCYGNVFVRFSRPFRRVLTDSRGSKLVAYDLSQFPDSCTSYDYKNMVYAVPDPQEAASQGSP